MQVPSLGYEPDRRTSRPLAGRAAANPAPGGVRRAPSSGARPASAAAPRKSNFAPKATSAAGFNAAYDPSAVVVAAVPRAAVTPVMEGPPPPAADLQGALIHNLRNQVAYLEMQLKELRLQQQQQQQQQQQVAAASHQGQPSQQQQQQQQVQQVVPAPQGAQGMQGVEGRACGVHPADASGPAGRMARHVQTLEDEVAALKTHYADRERQHQAEVTEYRRALEAEEIELCGDAAGSDGTGSKEDYARRAQSILARRQSLRQAQMAQVRAEHQKQEDAKIARAIAETRDHCAQGFAELQQRCDRLQAELAVQGEATHAQQADRDRFGQELVMAREHARAADKSKEVVDAQYQQTQAELKAEQEKRCQFEHALRETKAELDAVMNTVVAEQRAKIEELERTVKEEVTKNAVVQSEVEKARASEAALSVRIRQLAEDVADKQAQTSALVEAAQKTAVDMDDLKQKLSDIEAERDFHKLDVARLNVENSTQSVEVIRLTDRASRDHQEITALKKEQQRFNDRIAMMERQQREQQQIHAQVTSQDQEVRKDARRAADEASDLKRRLDGALDRERALERKCEDLSKQADLTKTEQQLREAVERLQAAKIEMRTVLESQMRVATDMACTVDHLPTKATEEG